MISRAFMSRENSVAGKGRVFHLMDDGLLQVIKDGDRVPDFG